MFIEQLLTIVNSPITINNPGLFFAGVVCYSLAMILVGAYGLLCLRDNIEELTAIEAIELFESPEIQTQTRMSAIMERVKGSFDTQEVAFTL